MMSNQTDGLASQGFGGQPLSSYQNQDDDLNEEEREMVEKVNQDMDDLKRQLYEK
jgi:hypothetical protein